MNLTIRPNGINKPEVKLHFNDPRDIDNYAKREREYCSEETKAFSNPKNTVDREKQRAKVLAKRVKFAREEGFHPHFQIKDLWVR